MSYRYDGRQCPRCGSYIPANWTHCGRCGQPVKRRRPGGLGWALLLFLLLAALVFRTQLSEWIQDRFYIDDKNERVSENTIGRILPQIHVRLTHPTATPSPSVEQPKQTATATATPKPESEEARQKPAASKPAEAPVEKTETSSLTYEQKVEQIRALVREAMKNGEEEITLPVLGTGDDSRVVFDIINKLILDDPEIMFYDGCRYRTDGRLTLKYSKSRDFIVSAVQATSQQADAILSRILAPGMTDFEKELAIHDYIVNNCRYDIENQRNGTTPPEDYSAYGVLVNGTAVCEGYAKAMKLLLDRAGVPCLVVSGRSKGSSHAWNLVCLDGQYYHVDATWDDPVMSGGEQILSHVYFNLTDEDIQRDHAWDTAAYPQCSGTAFNYYNYYGLTVDSPDAFTSLLAEAAASGKNKVSCRIVNYADGGYDIPGLVQKAAFQLGLGSLTYSVNDLYGVVDIWVK